MRRHDSRTEGKQEAQLPETRADTYHDRTAPLRQPGGEAPAWLAGAERADDPDAAAALPGTAISSDPKRFVGNAADTRGARTFLARQPTSPLAQSYPHDAHAASLASTLEPPESVLVDGA